MLKQEQKEKSQKLKNPHQKQIQNTQNTSDTRIKSLSTMAMEQKNEIEKNIKRITTSLLNQRKYKKYRKQLQQRIQLFDHYHKHIMNQFFGMITNEQIISLTTQNDLLQKIQKLKKSIFTILNRIHLNLDSQNSQDFLSSDKLINSEQKIQEDIRKHNNDDQKSEKEVRERSRGKNTKINNESVLQMTLWLLKNFQNPYPTLQEKSQMAKKSGLSLVQVNNWFINARERVIKKYQCKQPHVM